MNVKWDKKEDRSKVILPKKKKVLNLQLWGKKCQEKIATGKNGGLQKETHKWRSKWATQRDEVSRAASQQHSPDQSSVSITQNPEWRIRCSGTLWINLKSTFHLCYFWPVHPWENPFALVCSSIKGAKMRPRSWLAPHSCPPLPARSTPWTLQSCKHSPGPEPSLANAAVSFLPSQEAPQGTVLGLQTVTPQVTCLCCLAADQPRCAKCSAKPTTKHLVGK